MIRRLLLRGALIVACAAAQEEVPMTTYQVAFLKRGPAWTPQATPESRQIQAGHMAHIGKMAKTGKLILAGPFADTGDLRGMFVFKAEAGEARRMAEEDPAVKSGRLVLEWHPWYSAEGIAIVPPAPAAKSKQPEAKQ